LELDLLLAEQEEHASEAQQERYVGVLYLLGLLFSTSGHLTVHISPCRERTLAHKKNLLFVVFSPFFFFHFSSAAGEPMKDKNGKPIMEEVRTVRIVFSCVFS